MNSLNRKMIRDLFGIKGQAAAICAVIAAGIATFVMSLSTVESIRWSQDTYYDRYGFADVFAHLKRAPKVVADQIQEIPGVARVETRIVFDVTVDVKDMVEPAVGRLISVPDSGKPRLNGVYLRSGRWLAPYQSDEVMVAEPFAESHRLLPGDHIVAIINGRRQQLKIVGIVLSPEYLIHVPPGNLLPDDRRFGVFYMGYEPLAAALNMEGAFNDISLTLMRGALEADVLKRLDDVIEPYGGIGSYGRSDQVSHQYISDEIRQLRAMGIIGPTIFLSVSAFLLNVVVSRVINTQREQIASLKAFGYDKREIASHYLKMILVIPLLGTAIGTGVGCWMGNGLTRMYAQFYRFPIFSFQLDMRVAIWGLLISCVAAIGGTLWAVGRAVALAPAEAMRPEPPANYRPTLLEKTGIGLILPHTLRIILRNLERRPLKALFSILGIGMGVSVLIVGSFMLDAINYIMDYQFRIAQRQDVILTFVEPSSARATHDARHLPGVLRSEPFRALPVRMRYGHRHERTSIMGLPKPNTLFRLIDDQEREVAIPERGLLLSSKLAELIAAVPGDLVTVEILEGERKVQKVPVAALITEFSGMNAYMSLDALRRMLQEGDTSTGVFLQVDSTRINDLYRTLKETPRVVGITIKSAMLESFQSSVAENLLRMRTFNILFATIIAFGVVYNSARISLSERRRELSTLRVIGFTRTEISSILLGELGVLTAAALPVGSALGYCFAWLATFGLNTEIYRIPLVVEMRTFAYANLVVLVAVLVSGLIVRRRLDKLDLIAVLKSKE